MTEDDPPKATWQYMYEYGGKITRAVERCGQLADQEAIMGYADSAKAYREMSAEIGVTRNWVSNLLTELVKSAA